MVRPTCQVWAVLRAQGRMQSWLAAQTGIALKRLWNLKYGELRGGYWWRDEETQAVSRALGVPREVLFPPGSRVLPPGWKRPRRQPAGGHGSARGAA